MNLKFELEIRSGNSGRQ